MGLKARKQSSDLRQSDTCPRKFHSGEPECLAAHLYTGHLHAGEAVMGEGERLSNETVGQFCGTE